MTSYFIFGIFNFEILDTKVVCEDFVFSEDNMSLKIVNCCS